MRIIAKMPIRNEVNRYLEGCIDNLAHFVDGMVFVDDASTDGSLEVVKRCKKTLGYARTEARTWHNNEAYLRGQLLWGLIKELAVPGDWILSNDADEFIPEVDHKSLKNWVSFAEEHDMIWCGLQFHHFWSETHYRVDKLWKPLLGPRLFKYIPGNDAWHTAPMGCPPHPIYVSQGKGINTGIRIKHMAYARSEDRLRKYNEYMAIDGGTFHQNSHIQSIIDPEPVLEEWRD